MAARFTDDEIKQLYNAGWVVWRPDAGPYPDDDVAIYRFGDDVYLFEADERFVAVVPRLDRPDGDDGHSLPTDPWRVGWRSQIDDPIDDRFENEDTVDVLGDELAPEMIGALNADQSAGSDIVGRFEEPPRGGGIDELLERMDRLRSAHVTTRKAQLGINPKIAGGLTPNGPRVDRVFDEAFDEIERQFPDFGVIELFEDEKAGADNGAGADRQFAYCKDGRPLVIAFAPKAEPLSVSRLRGLMRHEFGHALEYRYGVAELERRLGVKLPAKIERRADAIAEAVWGQPIRYDERFVQCVSTNGVFPRPAHLPDERGKLVANPADRMSLRTVPEIVVHPENEWPQVGLRGGRNGRWRGPFHTTQKSVSRERVEQVRGDDRPVEVFITKGNKVWVVDGHHRLVARLSDAPGEFIPVWVYDKSGHGDRPPPPRFRGRRPKPNPGLVPNVDTRLKAALAAMRLYLGSISHVPPRVEERFYERAMDAASKVAQAHGIPVLVAWEQIEQEARRLGHIRPRPGQHY